MCGIVAIFARRSTPPHRDLWEDLVNHLRHRGPDEGAWWADGPFFLGHRRLSIIDLQDGGQPMATRDARYVVSFNGEIYNYVELRSELEARGCRFETHSDTEVLLHGYRTWGTDLPVHLVGMFAFAIADRHRAELFVARDRFGEKPLFYHDAGDYVAFASELRPLAALPDLPREIDVEALGGYLSLNYVPGTATLLKSVRRVAPAEWKLFTSGGCRTGTYWAPPADSEVDASPGTDEEVLEEWREKFDHAVRICLRSDVPVGIFLSGGMDSSLIAESAVRQGHLSNGYVVDFEEHSYGEFEAAQRVADQLGLPLDRVVLTPKALERFLDLVEHADDPLADSSCLPVWVVSQLASRKNKVVLGGDGGDELFAGYLTYRATQLHQTLFSRLPGFLRAPLAAAGSRLPTSEGKVTFSYKLRRFLRAVDHSSGAAHLTWNGTWLPAEAAGLLVSGPERETVRHAFARHVRRVGLGGTRPSLLALQRADVAEYLPNDIMAKVDRMSMAHSLETRAPFLDRDLADWSLRLPEQQKISRRGELKTLLRKAAGKTFGPEIGNRPKQGFSIPIHDWVRGPLGDTVRDLLSAESVHQTGFLCPDGVQKVVDAHFSGRRSYGFEIWGLAVLLAWFRTRVQHPPAPPHRTPLLRREFEEPRQVE